MSTAIKQFFKTHRLLISLALLVGLYLLLYKIYMPRVTAFGCFDDCNNFMGGYFLLQGKHLFTEIFFNHNPFMAYVSFLVQFFTLPENLYELILRHRQALFIFSFVFNVLLLLRFGLSALAFTFFYELTKFYLFGDRFLAEAFIVYPLIYLVGLVWLKLQKVTLLKVDYILAGVFVWFIAFMREPYVPVAFVLFVYLLWVPLSSPRTRGSRSAKRERLDSWFASRNDIVKVLYAYKNSIVSFGIFFFLSLGTLLYHDLKEFYFNVVTANLVLVSMESGNIGMKIFFYPILLFFGGEWGHFRQIILGLNILFLAGVGILLLKRQWKVALFIFITLGLLNVRYVNPGATFYGAFHLLCWYGVFLFISFSLLAYCYKVSKHFFFFLAVCYGGVFVYYISSPISFFHEKQDPHVEFITNYGGPLQNGIVINSLSIDTDTLFVDGFDDIIYWQAQRVSSYPYSWYTSLMPLHKKYTDARIAMFRKSPPDFYYGSCPKEQQAHYLLPDFIRDSYVRLYSGDKPSCLWVKKTKLPFITTEQWKKAAENNYYLEPK